MMHMAKVDTSAKHEEIIDFAMPVLFREGFRATRMEQLIEGSGISKRTLYKHFKNKEELVLACLDRYQKQVFASVAESLARSSADPAQRILGLFNLKLEEYAAGNFQGCFAINAKLEYEGRHPQIEGSARQFYGLVLAFLEENCRALRISDPITLARQILVLFQGSIVSTKVFHDEQFTRAARTAVETLLTANRS